MDRDEIVRDLGELLEVGPELAGAQGAVEAEGEGLGVPQRVVEGLGGLPGKRPSRGIGDCSGDHDRDAQLKLVLDLLHGIDGCLGVQRVEDGLNHEDVRAALQKRPCLLGVALSELVKGYVPRARILHVRRYRGGAPGRPQDAGDKAGL